ncbi:MAG: hypothetical protein IKE69_09090 [Thermoguttaceae bacterium]|nr:hypothetical protein [Thermoguttaceae bacterium]
MSKEDRDFMTREDLFQLELLADGELDEESRRDLLERLDRTDDGWRYCAMAFLQAQCLGESLGGENPFAETGSEDSSEKSAGVLAAPAFDLRPTEPARPETALRRKRTLRIAALMSSACALLLVGLVGVRFFADRGGGPRVPNVKTESRYAERSESDELLNFTPNGAPVSTPEEVPAEFAADDFDRGADAEPTLADAGAVMRMSPKLSEVAPRGGLKTVEAFGAAPSGLSIAAKSASPRTLSTAPAGGSKVQHITIRRPGGLDEISVPCVEADSYVPDRSAAESLAQNYREAGCQVETLHEELKFRLQNGKTVIVPVDTIDVQRAPNRTHFL